MKNIFICHRPYHILRSANLIYQNYINDENILISFNLIQIESGKYLEHMSFPSVDNYFSKTIFINRNDDVRIWNLFKFLKYYKNKIKDYLPIVDAHKNFTNLFFFSDMERPIEILVGLFKEQGQKGAQIILVDEGLATYFNLNERGKDIIKSSVVKLFRLKYLNPKVQYGSSNLYTKAMASYPEQSTFKGNVIKLPILNPDFLNEIINNLNLNINLKNKYLLYLSNILDKSYGISREREIDVLIKLRCIAEKCGYVLYIKPHPVQETWYSSDNEMLKPCVVEPSVPAELFYSENGVVVSMGSSGLLNSYMMGVRSFDIGLLFNCPVEWYPKVTSIEMPKDFSEIEKILKEI